MSKTCKCGHRWLQHSSDQGCLGITEEGKFCSCNLGPEQDAAPFIPASLSSPETILQEAQRLVYGERGAAYGHPKEDFGRAAAIFNAITGENLDASDIGYVLLSVKLSRQQHEGRRDNFSDAAGYLECLARVEGWDI